MHINAQTHSSGVIFPTSILWTMPAHENIRKTISSQRLWQENFVVILNSFIRLRNQVTNVRVVKRTRHKKYIDRLPLCVLRSFELFFIGLICGVSVWASLVVVRLKEIRLRSLTVFPCFVFCRMFLRRNRTRTTRTPRFNANYLWDKQAMELNRVLLSTSLITCLKSSQFHFRSSNNAKFRFSSAVFSR